MFIYTEIFKMNLESRFQNISQFLKHHEYLHEVEVLKRYPEQLPDEYQNWVKEIQDFSIEQLALFETECDPEMVNSQSFKHFLQTIKDLRQIDSVDFTETQLPNHLKRKLNIKKRHEVQLLKTVIDEIEDIDTFIDIGSGAGHLSSVLLHQTNRNAFCIDINEIFQEQGKKKLQRWSSDTLEKLQFINVKIEKDYKFPFDYNHKRSLMIGLHSCGPLSTYLVEHYHQHQLGKMLNFGCCYEKITREDEYNLSQLSKLNPLTFKNNALHLAARSFAHIDIEELNKRIRVKKYRYALHYFVNDQYGCEFYSVGNGHKDDYHGEFSLYAKKFHNGVELSELSHDDLNTFYQLKSTQQKIWHNILADLIRGMLGRLVELYIVLDRAIYLQENGHNVSVNEYFKRKLSPRNLGILATRII